MLTLRAQHSRQAGQNEGTNGRSCGNEVWGGGGGGRDWKEDPARRGAEAGVWSSQMT